MTTILRALRANAPQRVQRQFVPRINNKKLRSSVVTRADVDEEEFEKRLAGLTKSKVPYGQSRKDLKEEKSLSGNAAAAKREVDYSNETLWRELAPAKADLALNIALGVTLVWLPLTASAIGRCAFVSYRITDKRIVAQTNAPWKQEESQVGFHEVAKVVGVSRGFGAWGDMVITLSGGEKLELRSIPEWQEVRDYILDRRDQVRGKDLSPEELLNGPLPSRRGDRKGFS